MLALPLAAPALPLDEAGKYVAGAYIVFLALLLIYLAIMSIRLARIDRELGELAKLAESRPSTDPDAAADELRQAATVGAGPASPGRPNETGREAEDFVG